MRNELARSILVDDGSPYALHPDDPAYLEGIVHDMEETIECGRNANTRKGELSAWRKYYLPYCRRLRTSPWRGFAASSDPMREAVFAGGFCAHVDREIKPRKRTDKAARAGSVRNVLAHVRRMHDRRGFVFAASKLVTHVLRGVARRRLAKYGVALPVRAEPFTSEENVAMKDIPTGTVIDGVAYDPSSRFGRGWRLVDTFADQAGIRKQEAVGYDDAYIARADNRVMVDGVIYSDPDADTLRRMRDTGSGRDLVLATVTASKADFDGSRFGPNVVALLYNADNPMSYAAAFIAYELAFPLRGAARLSAPMFTTDGVTRWSGARIDRVLRSVMAATLAPAQRKGKTFHSKRVWAATSLTARGRSEANIMALVRWATPESLRVYARMHLLDQARMRDNMLGADVLAVNATALPIIDATPETDARLDALADELDGEGE